MTLGASTRLAEPGSSRRTRGCIRLHRDAADVAFTALTSGPEPLSIDLDVFGLDVGLPAGVMTLPAVRDWLLAHPRDFQARDAVWAEVIRRARPDGPPWVIGAVGMPCQRCAATSASCATATEAISIKRCYLPVPSVTVYR
jgi:hypothetical protein